MDLPRSSLLARPLEDEDSGMLFVHSTHPASHVYALGHTDGKLRWTASTAEHPAADLDDGRSPAITGIVPAGGVLYVTLLGPEGGSVWAVSAANGTEVWRSGPLDDAGLEKLLLVTPSMVVARGEPAPDSSSNL